MKTRNRSRLAWILVTVAALTLASPAHAATMSASPTPPVVAGADIANFGTVTGTDKWFAENNTGAGSAKGQTFTTGSRAVQLKAIAYQVTASQKAEPTKHYVIRVGTVSGTTFTQIYSETATQTFTWNGGEYMTWTLATPVLLSTNRIYGVDIGMTSSTSAWQTGIPYLNFTANGYAGGQFYSSGANGVGNTTMTFSGGSDRIFHIRLQDPMSPSPENGATVPAGDVTLSWSNLNPNVGTDVYVNVWFGTNAAALAQVLGGGTNTTSITVSAPVAATYYWRVDSYLDGAPTGTPVTGPLFTFLVVDSDGDGIPDAWMMTHFGHPTGMADDLSRAPDDADSDGLTNLQEYQLGTDPNEDDTDGDGLRDGAEVNTYQTNPATADTDGDGLSDGAEVNTHQTNPTAVDTDGDGLSDGIEVNTYHTNPLLTDTDGDGAGDWYEVAATYTDPTAYGKRPNVPYPLPDPDATPTATNKPVKVFILSGQSNMVGMGQKAGAASGTLETVCLREFKFPNLQTTSDTWSVRSDVMYRGVITAIGNAPLATGQGADSGKIGPEVGFGHVMGYHYNEPVLLIKASQGNRGLFWDLLPPGSPGFTNGATVYAAYGESPNSWPVGGGPSPFVWYAGKQYDDFFLAENDMGAPAWADATAYPVNCQVRRNGVTYISKTAHTSSAASEPGIGAQSATYWNLYSVFNVTDVLDNFATQYPQWAAQGFEISGYVWFQGNWDIQGALSSSRYETNLVQLINHVRAYYATRYPGTCSPTTPFVLSTGCGDPQTSGNGLVVANAQLAVSDSVKHPEFAGTVKTMDTRGYWRSTAESPTTAGYHYNGNAETFMLVGDALGRGMLDMLKEKTPPSGSLIIVH